MWPLNEEVHIPCSSKLMSPDIMALIIGTYKNDTQPTTGTARITKMIMCAFEILEMITRKP